MKKILALALCVVLAFAATGCKKDTPQDLEKELTQKLADAKYLDTNIKATVDMNLEGMGAQQMVLDGSLKLDISGEFPKMSMDGSMAIANLMTLPFGFYMDDSTALISMLGQSQEVPIDETTKNQFKTAMQANKSESTISKTVEETKYNEQKALKINFDLNQLNTVSSAATAGQTDASPKITKMDMYYVLTDSNDLKSIVADLVVNSEGQDMTMNLTMDINSIGQPVEITKMSTATTQAAA